MSTAAAPPLEDPPPGPFAVRTGVDPAHLFGLRATGSDRFPREILERHHRERVLRGALTSLAGCGYAETSVERLIATAGVSRHTFYAQFPDKEACFLAAYDGALEWLEAEVGVAVAGADGGWPEKLGAAVRRVLVLLAGDPGVGRLLTAEILCVGPAGQARHRATIERLIPLLRLGRAEQRRSPESTPRLEFALLSGATSVLAREVGAGRGERLTELAPDLTEFLLVPYLGHAETRRIARRRPPSRR